MPLDTLQEWRDQNSRISYPFGEGVSIPNDFIVDLRFFYDRNTVEDVYLSGVDLSAGVYDLEFRYESDDTVAISGSCSQVIDGDKALIWGPNNESLVVIIPGKSWFETSWATNGFPLALDRDGGALDRNAVIPPQTLLRRIIINTDTSSEETWRKECVHSINGGTAIELNIIGDDGSRVVEISADMSSVLTQDSSGISGILTINGIPPNTDHGFFFNTIDCTSTVEVPNIDGTIHENALEFKSSCFPCCGCDSYRAVAAMIDKTSKSLDELCEDLQDSINASFTSYEDAVASLTASPVTRVMVKRVTKDSVILNFQNLTPFRIHGLLGVSIGSSGSKTFSVSEPYISNYTVSSLPPLPPTPSAYSKYAEYVQENSLDQSHLMPLGATSMTGTIGTIDSADSMDVRVTWSNISTEEDLRVDGDGIVFTIESNGAFGSTIMLGCQKTVYSFAIRRNTTEPCDPGVVTAYRIED